MNKTSFFLFALSLALLSGCGGSVYQPSRIAGFELEPEQEIDDEAIEKAFSAKPQIPSKPNVAYYVFDDEYAEGVSGMIDTLPDVHAQYRIPGLMVDGSRRFDKEQHYYGAPPKKPLSMKKLRLLAARAHSDLLVVVDYGYHVSDDANALAALGVLIVPIFFTPMRDITVESYVDSYVIDTRNGYLYGHVQTSREQEKEYVDVWTDVSKDMIADQFDELMDKTGKLMTNLLAEERSNSVSPLRQQKEQEEKKGTPLKTDAVSSRE